MAKKKGNSKKQLSGLMLMVALVALVAAVYIIKNPTTSLNIPPSPSPVAQEEDKPTAKVEKIVYQPISSWKTYTDNDAKFSIQYFSQGKIDSSEVGKSVRFLTCYNDPAKGEICLNGFSVQVYDDYNGGSRRQWLLAKMPDLKTYKLTFEDVEVGGVNSLIVYADDPGSMSNTFALLPKGKKMYVLYYPAGSKQAKEVKQVLSTFKFVQ